MRPGSKAQFPKVLAVFLTQFLGKLILPNSDSLQLQTSVPQMCTLGHRRGLGESMGMSGLQSIIKTGKTTHCECSTNGAWDIPPMYSEDSVTHMLRQRNISLDGNMTYWKTRAYKRDKIKTSCLQEDSLFFHSFNKFSLWRPRICQAQV